MGSRPLMDVEWGFSEGFGMSRMKMFSCADLLLWWFCGLLWVVVVVCGFVFCWGVWLVIVLFLFLVFGNWVCFCLL